MIAILDQPVGMTEPTVARDYVGKSAEKVFSIPIVQEDSLPGIATGGQMVDGSREFNS